MPFEPLRYLHAANLNLDVPLTSIGECEAGIREIVEDATLTSFELIIRRCIEHDVDLLLLSGNTFREADRSLRARLALRRGFDKLAEQGIRIFIQPGKHDPAEAWRDFPRLPDNVTVFFDTDTDNDPVAVMRGDRVIASVSAGTVERFLRPSEPVENGPAGPWRIGIAATDDQSKTKIEHSALAVDYLALGGNECRQSVVTTNGTAHHPGGAQGMSVDDHGPHGCTLVEVGEDRRARLTLLETAPVCWKRIAVAVTDDMDYGELVELMRDELHSAHPTAVEQLQIVAWTLRGAGELFDALQGEDVCRKLFESLESTAFPESHTHCLMTHRLIPQRDRDGRNRETASNSLIDLYDSAIDALEGGLTDFIDDCCVAAGVNSAAILREYAASLNAEDVISRARRCGDEWLGGNRAEGKAA